LTKLGADCAGKAFDLAHGGDINLKSTSTQRTKIPAPHQPGDKAEALTKLGADRAGKAFDLAHGGDIRHHSNQRPQKKPA